MTVCYKRSKSQALIAHEATVNAWVAARGHMQSPLGQLVVACLLGSSCEDCSCEARAATALSCNHTRKTPHAYKAMLLMLMLLVCVPALTAACVC